jgi:hypothetical protein
MKLVTISKRFVAIQIFTSFASHMKFEPYWRLSHWEPKHEVDKLCSSFTV